MSLQTEFLQESFYVDYRDPQIQKLINSMTHLDNPSFIEAAFTFVRDEIPHTSSTDRQIVTYRASDVLREGTGICHAKANLLAALLRGRGIGAGFGFQRLTVEDDDSSGYCLHAFVQIEVHGTVIGLDPHPNVSFSLQDPEFAYPNRPEYNEYQFSGIWSSPDPATMVVLETSPTLSEALANLPDFPSSPAWSDSPTLTLGSG